MSSSSDPKATNKTIYVIQCWSAPRSRSTALCYSFEARGSDCIVLDEPLYRSWLIQQGNAVTRPYLQNIIEGVPPPPPAAADNTNDSSSSINDNKYKWERELLSLNERIVQAATKLPDHGIIFCKEMAKFHSVYDFNNEIQHPEIQLIHKHVLLIRDPVAVLSSWSAAGNVHGDNPTPDEVGIVPLLHIYSTLQSRCCTTGSGATSNRTDVVVLDSDELVASPEMVLAELCNDLHIPYMDSMMTWESGEHECDGPWAAWWYGDVHKSSGWHKNTPDYGESKSRYRIFKTDYMIALKSSYPAYEFLKRLTRGYQNRGPLPSEVYEDPRNEHVLVYIGAPNGRGRIIPRDMAGVSPWDSSVQGGDACWEGLRVYRGKILHLNKHLRRLQKSAKALGFDPSTMHTQEEIIEAIFRVLAANGMRDGAHMRLTLTRGEKCTSSMNPKFNVYGTTLIILPEWKPTEGATTYDNTKGISLITASQRRNPPQTVDSKIHHNNLINNIIPKIQANLAGAGDAIMLDLEGYVSETNATNLFMVDNGVLLTPHADHCLPGITRETVLQLAQELNIPTEVRRISLSEFHSADEVFTTGTMGELTPVTMIDGRIIGPAGERGPITTKLQEVYKTLPDRGDKWATPIPEFE